MLRTFIKTGLALASIAVFAVLMWLAAALYLPRPCPSDKVFFEIPKGMSVGAMARELKAQRLISARLPFVISYYLFFSPEKIKAGEYLLRAPLRGKDILEMMVKGKVYLHAVTIPEGLTAEEIAPLFAPLLADGEHGFAVAFRNTQPVAAFDREAKNLEGYLFPETYSFARGISSEEVIRAMVAEFDTVFDAGRRSRAAALRMTVRQVVILASLIEKETAIPEEKRFVSAVFHNRLGTGMKLDCDPTIIYALKLQNTYQGRLRKKDLGFDSAYNTYLYPGLPPGPICNPGKEAIEAALFPAEEEYLYFVSKNDGSHHFSRTFAEHQTAVRQYQKNR
jgi:UPF0755 protein